MSSKDIYLCTTQASGALAGVFEYDGEVGYLYLYDCDRRSNRILASIQVVVGVADFEADDLSVRWNREENLVGLFICDELWAAFDVRSGMKFGGDYRQGSVANVPDAVKETFAADDSE